MAEHPARVALTELDSRHRTHRFPPWPHSHRYHPERARGFRQAAVLVLLAPSEPVDDAVANTTSQPAGTTPEGPGADIFLVQRSAALRDHPGEIALPGGRIDTGEDPIAAALRETHEEIGLHPDRAEVLGQLPPAMLPVSSFVVHPVLAWTEASGFERAQPGEVVHALRVPIAQLLDPQMRRTVQVEGLPTFSSAGFWLSVGWVWGFTGNLLDHLFTELGWTRPWDTNRRYVMPVAEARGKRPAPVPRREP